MKIGIFKGFSSAQTKLAADACKDLGIEYEIVDILSSDWIDNIKQSGCDGFYCMSTCASIEKKQILDERYFFVSQLMRYPIYPNYLGLFIHENKRNMAMFGIIKKMSLCSIKNMMSYPLSY